MIHMCRTSGLFFHFSVISRNFWTLRLLACVCMQATVNLHPIVNFDRIGTVRGIMTLALVSKTTEFMPL